MTAKRSCAVALGLFVAAWAHARDEDYVETVAFLRTVSVVFNGSAASVSNGAADGVTFAQSGASLVFSNTLKQVAFALSGASAAGKVKIYSEHPFKLSLNGVALVSPDGPAVNVQSRKICYVVLPAGATNALTDGATYSPQYDATNGVEDAKGVVFSEGPLAFSGEGSLAVNGVCAGKHGVCSDDYVRLLGGDVRVSMSKKSDGVHVNERFRMDGGKLAVALTLKGDGIDADDDGSVAINGGELTLRLLAADSKGIKCGTNTLRVAGGAVSVRCEAADCNALSGGGDLTVSGGVLDVTLSGDGSNAVKSDRSITVAGGAVSVTATGAQTKGFKTDGDAVFNGGTMRMSLSGDAVLTPVTNAQSVAYVDPSFSCGVKASNIVVNAGSFALHVGGRGGRGISADDRLVVNGGSLAVAASGGPTAAFTNESQVADLAGAACLRAGRQMAVSGGAFSLSVSGNAGKGISVGALSVSGGRFDMELTGAPAFVNRGNYLEPSFCAAVKSDGDAVVSNGTFAIRHTGVAGRGFSVDTNFVAAGGVFAITVTGTNTAVYTSGVYVVNGAVSNYLDVGAASAIKVGRDCVLGGGSFNLLATGCCGKGLNVGGMLAVGTNAIAGSPSLTVRTTGTQFKISGGSSSGGGPGGGGAPPDDSADYSNPKAVKVTRKIVVNCGSLSVATVNAGGEGLESKDAITVNGGTIEATCYDDCMNAATNITINGGSVFCSASNNDGIDSNGTITMNGGAVASFGTTAPEEGLDCDQNTFTVNGGTFVGCGGATSYPNAGSQYSLVYTGSLSSNAVMRIANASGTSLFAFKMPRTYSGNVVLLCGCSGIASSGTYTVYTGSTVTGKEFHGLYTNGVSSAAGGTSKGSDSTPTSRYYAVP